MEKMRNVKKYLQILVEIVFVAVFVFLISGISANASTFTYKGKTYDTANALNNYAYLGLTYYSFSLEDNTYLIYVTGELQSHSDTFNCFDYNVRTKLGITEDDFYYISFFDCKLNGAVTSGNRFVKRFEYGDNFDTSEVTCMDYFFNYCINVDSIDLSKFDTSNVTSMHDLFAQCEKVEYLDLSGLNTSKVKDISYMFSHCTSLKSVNFTGFDTSKVENINGLFQFCSSLENVDLSGFNTSKVKSSWYLFMRCKALTKVDLSSFTYNSWDENPALWFYNCTNLKEITISNYSGKGINIKGDQFWGNYGCNSVEKLTLNNVRFTEEGYLPYPMVDVSSKKLYESLKAGTYNCVLEKAYIPNIGEKITSGTNEYIFKKDSKGTLVLSYSKNKSSTTTSVIIPSTVKAKDGQAYKVIEISSNAFKDNKKITTVEIGKNVTTIGKNAFANCTALKTINGASAVTTISDGAFSGCKVLKTLPEFAKVKTIGEKAFNNCVTITGFKAGSTSTTKIGSKAFYGCAKLKTVKGIDSVTSIGTEAFSGCKALQTVPAMSKLTSIGGKAFYNCAALTKFTIGSSVNKIGSSAFQNCKKLKTLTIKTTKLTDKNVGSNAFKSISSTATIKVPSSKLDAYKTLLKKKGITGSKQKITK